MSTSIDPRGFSGGKAVATPAATSVPKTDDIVIGMGVTSSGSFNTAGLICVDGVLKGADVNAAVLSISRGGEFEGKANVERLEVFGTLCGEVVASEQIVLRSSAVVLGKVTAPYIITHRGAAISGEVKSLDRRPDVQIPPALIRSAKSSRFRKPSMLSMMVGGLLLAAASGGMALGRWQQQKVPASMPLVADATQMP